MSREMKDSGVEWIGEIPEDWDVKRIKHAVVQMGSGTTPNSDNSNFYDGNIAWIQSGDLYNTPIITKTSKTVTEQAIQRCSALKIYHKPYIVIAMYGASVGNVSIASIDACTNQACCIIKPNDNNNIDYLKYWLEVCKTDFIRKSVGGGQPNISQDKVREQTYLCPSPTEQQQIVHFLDRKCTAIDTAIEKTKKSIEKLEEYKKAVITKAVTEGIDPNVKMKDSGVEWIGEIPEGWDVIKLKYLLKDSMKYGATETGIEYSEELPRYIRITDITSDNKLKDSGKLSLTEQQAEKYLLKEDTILFARSGATVGKTFLYKTEYGRAAFAGYMISAIPNNDKLLATWLYYYTLSFSYADWVKRSFLQATIQNIGADKYSNLLISLPCMNKQSEIVKYLDDKCAMFDVVIKKKKKAIEKWEEYKKSLIYYAVTGKIDCRNEVV